MVDCTLISDTLPVATKLQMLTAIDKKLTIGADSTMLFGIFFTLSEEESERRQMIRDKYLALSKVDERVCNI